MSTYTFTWPKGPQDVIITGNFDNWSGSVPLVKEASGDFSLTMPIPASDDDKFVFKFIVDGNWVLSDQFEKESSSGPENNVIYISKIGTASRNPEWIPESGLPNQAKKQKAQPAPGSNKKGKKKKIKVKKRIRKDKRTGEQTVISEERAELNSEDEESTEGTSNTATPKETTPLPAQTAVAADETRLDTTVMPSEENKQTTLGEPGVVIMSNPEEIKEFKEVRDVDAAELNAKLNAKLHAEMEAAQEESVENGVETEELKEVTKPVEEKPVVDRTLDPKAMDQSAPLNDLTEEVVVEEASPAEEPVVAEEVTPTEEPVVAEEVTPTEEPVVAEEVTPAEEPVVTEEVTPAEEPVITEEVTPAEEPVVTEEVTPAEEPVVTEEVTPAEEPVVAEEAAPAEEANEPDNKKSTSQDIPATANSKDSKPVKEEKKKKKGLFSKLKKIFK